MRMLLPQVLSGEDFSSFSFFSFLVLLKSCSTERAASLLLFIVEMWKEKKEGFF